MVWRALRPLASLRVTNQAVHLQTLTNRWPKHSSNRFVMFTRGFRPSAPVHVGSFMDSLSGSMSNALGGLRSAGETTLDRSEVEQALEKVRTALLQSDVEYTLTERFLDDLRESIIGTAVPKDVPPAGVVIKTVQDELTAFLGAESSNLTLRGRTPVSYLVVGIQGSGKTTTCAKVAYRLKQLENKRVLLVSLDTRRPAAQQQLAVLGKSAQIDTLPIVKGQEPLEIVQRAKKAAEEGLYDMVIYDSAGRLNVDDELMDEIDILSTTIEPAETLLVADAMTGQQAVTIAKGFHSRVPCSGIVLTRVDGDARGGAAVSMRAATGVPIKLIGVGEALQDLETFVPERIAKRIMGDGDLLSLAERARLALGEKESQELGEAIAQDKFDLNVYLKQIRQGQKLGGAEKVMSYMPWSKSERDKLAEAGMSDEGLALEESLLMAMTDEERANPSTLRGPRKKAIAKSCSQSIHEVHKLLKKYEMAKMAYESFNQMKKEGKTPSLPELAKVMAKKRGKR
uniref:signal-recognition-particle GTPase n=1 Tax=Eukaryota sp. TaxID=1928008 RepID=A0A895KNR0_9EUKA|nr:mitochondrial Ffh [Eukaryota sp.]